MFKKILIIGCGNIGSRHLQAILKLKNNIIIEIVEPNLNAQSLAKIRLKEIKCKNENYKLIWYNSLSLVKNKSDLVIVATNSKGRVKLIEKLLKLGHKKFIVEKIVCQSSEEYKKLLLLMKKSNAKAWINTNRRYFDVYQKIVKKFKNSKHIELSVFAGNSDLGTNAIHYLDLFSWLIQDNKIKLDGKFLVNQIFENKRGKNFKRFLGIVTGFNKDSRISLTFFPAKKEIFIIKISGEGKFAYIDELEESGYFMNNKRKEKLNVKFGHTSELTTKIIQDIFSKDDCLLPSLNDLTYSHKELFRIFNRHIKKTLNKDVNLCPIT
jgi:hypothetical protein